MRLPAIGVLGLSLALLARVAAGQADMNTLAQQMADQVNHLGEDISADLASNPAVGHLVQDTQELAQAVNDFRGAIQGNPGAFQARQAFAGIDGTWQHLRAQLARPGLATPAVLRAAGHVDQLAGQIRQSLGVNAPPSGFYGAGPAPVGIGETQRLAHALVARAEGLASVIQAEVAGNPAGAGLVQDAASLARAADAFHDAIDANQGVGVAAQAFGPVDALADRVEQVVTANPNQVSPRLQAAWQAFAAVEVLIHQNLGLPSPQPNVALSLVQPPGSGPSPVVGLADQLVQESNAFVQVYGPTAGGVPEGGLILIDGQRLQAAAARFRQDLGQGLDPNRLAYEFREVDESWQRLSRRVTRIARGRTGPNIAQVAKLGGICEQLHRVLGMPGYAPSFTGPYGTYR